MVQQQRQRAPGGGRKATLRTSRDKLFYILLYCKCYATFDLMSVLFDFNRSCAWNWVHGLMPILEQALGYKQVLPEQKLRSIEEFLERFSDVREVILDGTERPVRRPKDSEIQKENDSGKKKRHTRKHFMGTTRKKRVILLDHGLAPLLGHKHQMIFAVPFGRRQALIQLRYGFSSYGFASSSRRRSYFTVASLKAFRVALVKPVAYLKDLVKKPK